MSMAGPRSPIDPAENGSPLTPTLAYATKSELVYQHLRGLIVSGRLAEGSHLYLDEIARRLGLSTNPIREALRRLESEGLVTHRPHQGATVASIDPGKIVLHFQIRAVLEGLAVRLAAAALTEDDLDRLAALDRELDRLAAADDHAGWDGANLAFYRSLFDGARAPELVALIDVQRDRSPRYHHFPDVLARRIPGATEGRKILLAALREEDGEKAERVHRDNVERAGEVLATAMLTERPSARDGLGHGPGKETEIR
jgi:DNA-binding GntR family transcriptional regulator